MISFGLPLMHLLDTVSAQRGLSRADILECIKTAIVENFRLRGRIVTVSVENLEGDFVLSVQETILTGGGQALYREVRFIPPVSPELLREIIDEYAAKRQANHVWTLAECKAVAQADDHYLIEIISAQASDECENKIAVLPKKNINEGEVFASGEIIWCIIKKYERSPIDVGYAEAWRDVDADWIASRSDSNFLSLMAYQMMGEAIQGVIHTSRGILIFQPGVDLQPLLADGCRHKNILQKLCGLQRLAVARRSPRTELDKKLIHAIQEVAGLKYGADFKIGAEDPQQLPRIYISHEKAPRLMGRGGHNLFFIKCVVGFQFEIKVTSRITGTRK